MIVYKSVTATHRKAVPDQQVATGMCQEGSHTRVQGGNEHLSSCHLLGRQAATVSTCDAYTLDTRQSAKRFNDSSMLNWDSNLKSCLLYPSHLLNRKGRHQASMLIEYSINSNCGIPGWGSQELTLKVSHLCTPGWRYYSCS